MPTYADSPVLRAAVRRASLRLLPLIGVAYCMAYLNRVNISFAALEMNRQLHFSGRVFGLGAGLFFISYTLCQVPANLLLVRFGAHRWLAAIMFAWGVVSALTLLVRTPLEFYLARLALGAAEAGFFPGVIYYISQWFPVSYRSRAISRFYVAYPLSTTVMGVLAGSLLHLDGRLGLAGWQWLLGVEGLPAVLLSVVLFFTLTDSPSDAKWLTAEERLALREANPSAGKGDPRLSFTDVRGTLLDRRVWLLGGFLFCLYLASYGYIFTAPLLVRQVTGASAGSVGFITAGIGFCGALSMLLGAWSSDRRQERYWHVLLPVFAMATGLVLSAATTRSVPTICGLLVCIIGYNALQGAIWTIPTSFLEGESAATGVATMNMISMFGGLVGPYWMGWSSDLTGSYRLGLLLLALPVLLASLLMRQVNRLMAARSAQTANVAG